MRFYAENLSFGYDDGPQFADISLELAPQSLCCLIGPNGSGKSSLLRALLGLLPLKKGRVMLDGCDLATLSRKGIAQKIAYVPQAGSVAPITVYEAVLMGRTPHIRHFPRREDHFCVERVLERLSMTHWKDRLLSELSGGECQKVLIGKALAQETSLIFLDEPARCLDIRWQFELYELFRSLVKDEGKRLLVVEHDLDLAARYADSLYVLKKGRVVTSGPASDILEPALLREVYGIEAEASADGCGLRIKGLAGADTR